MPGPFENRLDNPAIRRRRKLAEVKASREAAFSSPAPVKATSINANLRGSGFVSSGPEKVVKAALDWENLKGGVQDPLGTAKGAFKIGLMANPVNVALSGYKSLYDNPTNPKAALAQLLSPYTSKEGQQAMAVSGVLPMGRIENLAAKGTREAATYGLKSIDEDIFRNIDDGIDAKFTDPLVEVGLEREGRIADGVANIDSFVNDVAVTAEDTTSVPVGSLQQYLRSGRIPDAGDYLLDSPTSGLGKLNPDDVVDVKLGGRTTKQNKQQVLAHFNSDRTRKMQSDLARLGVSYDDAKKAARASFNDIDINKDIFNINEDMLVDPDTGTYRTLQYLDPNSSEWRTLGDHADHIITADYVGKSIKQIADMDNPSAAAKKVAKGLYAWVNSKDNFVGLYGSANMSRGKRPAAEWQGTQPEEFVPTHRAALATAEGAFVEHMKKYKVSEKKAREIFAEATGVE